MYAGSAGLDHHFHQLKSVQSAAESGFRIGDDRRHKVHPVFTVEVMDLIRAHQGIVNSPNHVRHTVHGIQALVGIHVSRVIRVGRNLPAAEVDGLQPGLYLLHGLIAGERAERRHIVFMMQQPPQSLRTQASQRVLNLEGAAQLLHLLAAVRALGASPASVAVPLLGHFCGA